MPPLITYNDSNETVPLKSDRFFSLEYSSRLWSSETLDYEDFLEKLVFSIARKPGRLITHLQRIYFCFHKNLNEQLFAAIVDLMIVLDRRGQEISWRMIRGAKSRLSPEQFNTLNEYLTENSTDATLLLGNRYSILTKGLVGMNNLVKQIETNDFHSYDPLEIARDHIEFSQLEEAKLVLEKAILKQPTRQDLHHELLELYQSTLDSTGFYKMLTEIAQSGVDITAEWSQLDNFFRGRKING